MVNRSFQVIEHRSAFSVEKTSRFFLRKRPSDVPNEILLSPLLLEMNNENSMWSSVHYFNIIVNHICRAIPTAHFTVYQKFLRDIANVSVVWSKKGKTEAISILSECYHSQKQIRVEITYSYLNIIFAPSKLFELLIQWKRHVDRYRKHHGLVWGVYEETRCFCT